MTELVVGGDTVIYVEILDEDGQDQKEAKT